MFMTWEIEERENGEEKKQVNVFNIEVNKTEGNVTLECKY